MSLFVNSPDHSTSDHGAINLCSKRIEKIAVMLLLGFFVQGCTNITTHKKSGEEVVMTQEQFEKYVEQVFRYHNQVMNELIESSDELAEQNPTDAKKIKAAEKKMVQACHPLNEVVSESIAGETASLKVKMELADTVPVCEDASRQVDDLMP